MKRQTRNKKRGSGGRLVGRKEAGAAGRGPSGAGAALKKELPYTAGWLQFLRPINLGTPSLEVWRLKFLTKRY